MKRVSILLSSLAVLIVLCYLKYCLEGVSGRSTLSLSPAPLVTEREGVWDERRQFKTHLFAVTGSQWSALSSTRLLCLGAQTSLDRLHHLPELLTNWSGPVSISVFTPDIGDSSSINMMTMMMMMTTMMMMMMILCVVDPCPPRTQQLASAHVYGCQLRSSVYYS